MTSTKEVLREKPNKRSEMSTPSNEKRHACGALVITKRNIRCNVMHVGLMNTENVNDDDPRRDLILV